ncbi:hypothetical protein JY651_46390 [Pyxidicoccus parkwayensis]|uniref:Uncharacterized protein n=1 Tax=Pyxidicoccus parkwayensis TaxID=2813578 RepID=A0ABX7NU95_9BACT|nr:hypothetical protein [Pyxidicoccus parkwaysis]QSQ22470.1 hypothetical protein JY651_46390 [Pyxidicoccus parkwaysis]
MTDTFESQPTPTLTVRPRGLGALYFLLLAWLSPAVLASVLRATVGLPLWVGAAAGVLGAGVLTWRVLSALRPWPDHVPLVLMQVVNVTVALGLTWRMLGIPVMGGLASTGGGDAGNHAALRADFATRTPGTYQGFTIFHTVTYGLEKLFGGDAFTSFRAGFYLVPFVLALALVAGLEVVAVRRWRTGRAAVAAQVALLAAFAFVWPLLLLRLLHYHQAEGFYAHLFGLVPLVLAWLAYGLPRQAWARCVALALFTVFYRYTYGLNLGDFLFTCGALVFVEGRGLPPKWRRLAWPAGLLMLGAAAYAYWRLLPLAHVSGGFIPHGYERALRTQCWAVAGLLVVRFLPPRGEEAVERRLLDFALLFAGVNAAIQLAYLSARLPIDYYFLKYGLHAQVLLLSVLMLVASNRFGAMLLPAQAPRSRALGVGLAVLVAVMLVEVTRGWGRAFRVYEESYEERVRGQPPFKFLEPLEDRGAVAIVREVLRDNGKRFGGLLSPSWPQVNFTNVDLGWVPDDWQANNGHWAVFENGAVRDGPGACVFWQASEADWEAYRHVSEEYPRLEARVRQLHGTADKVCREYPAPWTPAGVRTLCYRCD